MILISQTLGAGPVRGFDVQVDAPRGYKRVRAPGSDCDLSEAGCGAGYDQPGQEDLRELCQHALKGKMAGGHFDDPKLLLLYWGNRTRIGLGQALRPRSRIAQPVTFVIILEPLRIAGTGGGS
jgi:hypothetical protein